MKHLLLIGAALMVLTAPATATTTNRCRDAHGKFIKCPQAAAPAPSARCKGANGRFVKCGTPGAHPA